LVAYPCKQEQIMVEHATGAAESAGGANSNGSVSSRLGQAAEQARDQATRLVGDARERAFSYADQQKSAAADKIGGVASVLLKTAEELRGQEQEPIADYVERAASTVEELADSIRSRDIPSMIDEVEEFARRNPGLFLGASMLAGFLLVRFLRASAERERSVEFRPDQAAWNDNDRRSSRPRRRSGKRAESAESA
jgi:hypothetical protein